MSASSHDIIKDSNSSAPTEVGRYRRSRLGIYDPSPGSSGPGRYVQMLLNGIDTAEFDVTMFCSRNGPYQSRGSVRIVAIDSEAASSGEACARASTGRARSWPIDNLQKARLRAWAKAILPSTLRLWSGFARDARRLAERFRQAPIDILHTQCAGCEEAPLAARMAGIPRILGTFHVDSTYDIERVRSGLGHRALEHISNRCLHLAIAVSEATKQDWVRRTHLPERRVLTIHNGIDPNHFRRRSARQVARRELGLPDDDRVIVGGVGRLETAKGFEYLIEALALLASSFPSLSLVIAGTGELREQLAAKAVAHGIGDRVHLLGFRADVRVVYDALDVFALSSLSETIGYVVLEAMAHELPIVGTSVGGVPEVVLPGETGTLVPHRDPVRMAAALKPLLESEELRRRMGANGRDRVVRHFQERDCVRKTIEVYRELLAH